MASTKSPAAAKKRGSTRSSKATSSAQRSQSTRRRSAGRSSSGNGASASPVDTVRETVASGAQSIGGAASKAKGPALTGGAALAGLVGGMAIAARGGRRKVLGIPVPGTRRPLVQIKTPRRKGVAKDVVGAARTMGKAGGQAAELATEVRRAREQLDSSRRRSPIEVVLDGLTARRGRAG